MEWISHSVTAEQAGSTLQDILTGPMGVSRRMIQRLTRCKGIKVNNKQAHLQRNVKAGDVIRVRADTSGPVHSSANSLTPQNIKLNILYEDEDILVLNKQPGVAVHPTKPGQLGTLSNGVAYHLSNQVTTAMIVRPVHRLDLNTSGAIIFAKNSYAHHQLDLQLRNRELKREYVAVVEGKMDQLFGEKLAVTIDQPIGRQKGHPTKRTIRLDGESAITHVRLLEYLEEATLICLELETGRTHQIRVHLSHLQHPLVGDSLYGGSKIRFNRQALHAVRLNIVHPRTKANLSFEAPLPEDMMMLINSLRI